jgi:hypothetical protein
MENGQSSSAGDLKARIDMHEAVCAERYKNIENALDTIKTDQVTMFTRIDTYIKWMLWALIAMALASVFGTERIAQLINRVVPGGA